MTDKPDFFFTLEKIRKDVIDRTRQNREEQTPAASTEEPVSNVLANLHKTIEQNMDEISKRIENLQLPPETPPFIQNMMAEQNHVQASTPTNAEQKQDTPTTTAPTAAAEKAVDPAKPETPKPTKLLDKAKIRKLKETVLTRVFGQDPVVEEVVDILKVSALNIKINKEKPAGNYLFAGPSGVGKTELAQTLSNSLEVPMLVINMGEYGLEQDVTKLIGTSPGYVGYQEGGTLTNFVMENPVCIILFDEIEKAHSSADKILLSIMDKGTATDNKGNKVSFKETIIISTSNLGADVEYLPGLDQAAKNKYRMEVIKENLRPEIINRYDSVFHFHALSKEIYKKVVSKFLDSLINSMKEEHKVDLKFSDKIMNFIVDTSFDPAMGGRPARRFIEKVVIKPLADYMLDENFEKAILAHPEITLDLNKAGDVCFKGKNKKILGVLENTEELVARIEEGKFTNKKTM